MNAWKTPEKINITVWSAFYSQTDILIAKYGGLQKRL